MATRLLERDDLLGGLREHAGAARDGSGSVVFIAGEAGAGKTSLVERFRRDLPSGTDVLCGACEPIDAPTPLGPLLDFAEELMYEPLARSNWETRRLRLFNSMLANLRAGEHPKVLVLEDLHWADEATLDLVRFLSRRIAEVPVLVIGTYRDDELGPDHLLRRLLGDLAVASTVHRLSVPPLSLAAVRDLASELNVDVEELHERSRGNPFFVTEVLASGRDRLPERVGDAVAARVSRLSRAARDTLELASVMLKHDLNVHFLSALVPDASAIDECIARGLLVGNGTTLGFRHDLVREAVQRALPPGRRRAAHARVLAKLEEDGVPTESGNAIIGGRERLSALAHHATEAGDAKAVLRYAIWAGQVALKYLAYREARVQFSRALPLADALPLEERARLLQDYAKVCCITGDYLQSSPVPLGAHRRERLCAVRASAYRGSLGRMGNRPNAYACSRCSLVLV